MKYKVNIRYCFSGTVQGVGFRWTACRVARNFPLSGWVRNEPDGRVLLEAEGFPDVLDQFIQALETAMSGNIEKVVRGEPRTAQGLTGFAIRT